MPWFWQTEYTREVEDDFSVTAEEQDLINQYGLTLGQIAWRRLKITEFSVNGMDGKKAFLQEYPCTSVDAFQTTGEDTYISSDIVMRARKAEAEKYGKLVIGVDPARFGDDRTAIIRRQGRVAFGLETYIKKDTMEVVGIVNTIIQNENPFKVFVDVGGLGAGVVDRLKELGHRDIIVAVNAGSTALDSRKYYNKRAEMWGLYKQWLLDEPCQIPDNNELHADSCGIRYKIDSNSRLVMEQKADMKKRGIRSSDTSDALCFEAGTLIHTPTGKKPIEQLSIGDEVLTPLGKTRICKTWVSETSLLTTVKFSNGSQLRGKGEHKIFTWNNGVCRMDALELTFDVEVYSKIGKLKWLLLKPLLTKAKNSEFRPLVDIINGDIPENHHIHHVDGNWRNNHISNLECISASDHHREHMLKRFENPEYRERNKKNLEKAIAKAAEWHSSPDGIEWHKRHAKQTWVDRQPHKLNCSVCSNEFQSFFKHTRFCSKSCRQKGCYAKQKTIPKICAWCNQEFLANKYRQVSCCSKLCSNRKRAHDESLQSNSGKT